MRVLLRRSESRARTRTDWLDSAHSFSFGAHYDPDDPGFGPLIAHNEDVLQPGPGYTMHAHRDTEILTWVLAGTLTHEDSAGNIGTISSGQLQCTSAGSGIRHAERSGSDAPVHLVQMWLTPDSPGGEASYRTLDVRFHPGAWVPVAAGDGRPGVLPIRRQAAVLSVARLAAGDRLALPDGELRHLFLATGTAAVAGDELEPGDALRVTGAGPVELVATAPAELLLWQLA